MSRKIDRALRGPSVFEVVLGAGLSLLLGIALAATLLVFRPVITVRQMPKEDAVVPDAIYFVEGSRDPAKARDVLAKSQAFLAGKSVSVLEQEMNAVAGPAAILAASTEKKPADVPPAEGSMLAPGTPNFRLHDGTLQVGMPVTVNALGLNQTIVVQARGGFEKQDDIFVYEPDVFYVGSLPLQRLPFLAGYARDQIMEKYKIPDEIKAAWTKLANVSVDGNVLNLTMP
jgi:hypothetical protein